MTASSRTTSCMRSGPRSRRRSTVRALGHRPRARTGVSPADRRARQGPHAADHRAAGWPQDQFVARGTTFGERGAAVPAGRDRRGPARRRGRGCIEDPRSSPGRSCWTARRPPNPGRWCRTVTSSVIMNPEGPDRGNGPEPSRRSRAACRSNLPQFQLGTNAGRADPGEGADLPRRSSRRSSTVDGAASTRRTPWR